MKIEIKLAEILRIFTKENIKIKTRNEGFITRIMNKIIPKWSNYCTLIYKTLYLPKEYNQWDSRALYEVYIHEYEHIKWNKFILPMILYLIGSLDYLFISMIILIFNLPYWLLLIFSPLILTGFLFPHFRSIYEYYGYRKSLKFYYEAYGKEISTRLLIDHIKPQFVKYYYFYMGLSFWSIYEYLYKKYLNKLDKEKS